MLDETETSHAHTIHLRATFSNVTNAARTILVLASRLVDAGGKSRVTT